MSVFLTYFLLVGKKRGGWFLCRLSKNGKCIFYVSSVRMGHKVYIFPILLRSLQQYPDVSLPLTRTTYRDYDIVAWPSPYSKSKNNNETTT